MHVSRPFCPRCGGLVHRRDAGFVGLLRGCCCPPSCIELTWASAGTAHCFTESGGSEQREFFLHVLTQTFAGESNPEDYVRRPFGGITENDPSPLVSASLRTSTSCSHECRGYVDGGGVYRVIGKSDTPFAQGVLELWRDTTANEWNLIVWTDSGNYGGTDGVLVYWGVASAGDDLWTLETTFASKLTTANGYAGGDTVVVDLTGETAAAPYDTSRSYEVGVVDAGDVTVAQVAPLRCWTKQTVENWGDAGGSVRVTWDFSNFTITATDPYADGCETVEAIEASFKTGSAVLPFDSGTDQFRAEFTDVGGTCEVPPPTTWTYWTTVKPDPTIYHYDLDVALLFDDPGQIVLELTVRRWSEDYTTPRDPVVVKLIHRFLCDHPRPADPLGWDVSTALFFPETAYQGDMSVSPSLGPTRSADRLAVERV